MGDYLKSWMILAFGILIIFGSIITVGSAQEPLGEENGIESEKESLGPSEGSNEEKQGYTEMFAKFDMDRGTLSGKYVSFEKGEGKIGNYTYVPEDESIFHSISFSIGIISDENTRMDSAVYHAEFEGLHITSHNNPTAMLHMVYNGGSNVNLSYVPAEGITFGEVHDGILPIHGSSSDSDISIGTENYTLKDDELNITLSQGEISCFIRKSYQTMSSFQETVIRSIQEGKIDGELQIMKKEGEIIESQNFPYEGKVQMRTKDSEIGKMIKIEVQSQEKAGKVLMFKVDGEILENKDVGKVRINFDGKEASMSGNVNEILEGSTSQCKYYIEKDGDGCYQAMVFVPEFSTHEIELFVDDDPSDSTMLGLGPVVVLLGSLVLGLCIFAFSRKRTN